MTEPTAIDEEEREATSFCVQEGEESKAAAEARVSRREKRKAAKKEKRKQIRKDLAEKARAEEEARLNDPEEQRRIQMEEERENERLERERREFEERERLFLEELARKKAEEEEEEERRRSIEEESKQNQAKLENESNEDDEWEYVEEGPPEIIWQGNEIIVKKKRVKVKKKDADNQNKEDTDRPTSNPLPPQSEAFADYKNPPMVSAQQLLDNVAQQVPNFGTEQDKAHCPFHIKTGACRFGPRCSRVHFYPDKSCTLLFKNMYNGPGLAWEQDEGLEQHTDEEVDRCYEEFYEDVHTELLKFGEIVNFKVCRNGSFHLRGNVYVHYKSLDSAVLAYHSTNGRYFAGKQVNCEFVSVTRWKVAICGEYMKSRFKTCSRGTACNFIHCFRNPGGDYEWADWDKPPPKYWSRKMVALFGYSDESMYDKQMEQEGSGQLRNSNRMLTAERDRYYSRRSRSRERDSLNGSSSRSRREEHDGRRSSHRERHTSDARKRPKTLEEKNWEGETNSRHDQHDKNRTRDTDSDGDWSDRGREVNKPRARTRKISRHRKETSEIPDDFGDHRNRICGIDSDGDFLDEERERGRRSSDRKKSPRKRNEVSESPNGHWNSRSRTHDSDYTGDRSDGDRDRHRSQRRESSRNSKKVSGLSDDHGESEKMNRRDSDSEKIEIQRVKRGSHSTKWDRSSIENSEADLQDDGVKSGRNRGTTNSDRYDGQRVMSHDLESRYDHDENNEKTTYRESENEILGKHKRSKRKLDCEEDEYEPGSPGRYSWRSKSRDSEYNPDEKDDERSRWELERHSPEKKLKSRSGGCSKDFEVKSKTHDGESRSRRSSRSSLGKHVESLDKIGSAELLQECEDNNKRYKRTHGHKKRKGQVE